MGINSTIEGLVKNFKIDRYSINHINIDGTLLNKASVPYWEDCLFVNFAADEIIIVYKYNFTSKASIGNSGAIPINFFIKSASNIKKIALDVYFNSDLATAPNDDTYGELLDVSIHREFLSINTSNFIDIDFTVNAIILKILSKH